MADTGAVSRPGATGTRRFGWQQSTTGEAVAEFLGTLVLIACGLGVVAMTVAALPQSGRGEVGLAAAGDWMLIAIGWGLAVTFGVYVAGGISGAHLNPAVTRALAVFKGFAWRKVPIYIAAQTAGAFVAALLVRWNYSEVLAKVDPGNTIKTQGVFSTLPGNGALPVSEWGALRDQIIGTAILLFIILALTDIRNNPPLANLTPVIIGFLVVAIGMAWGTDAGYAINPARDFGPRLASYLTGYETAWSDQYGNLYFWVPIIGPIIGGLVGAALYGLLIGRFLPTDEPQEPGELPSADARDTRSTEKIA